MSAMNVYRRALSKARQDREQRMKEVDRLDKLIRDLEDIIRESASHALENGKKKSTTRGRRRSLPKKVKPLEAKFAECSASEAAYATLKEAGGYLHIDKIVQAILEKGYPGGDDPKKVKANLFTTLVRRKHFCRHPKRKATFGLKEWDKKNELFDR